MGKIIGSAVMFDEDEVREARGHLLPRLIRVIFFGLGLTNDDYIERYSRYFNEYMSSRNHKKFLLQTTADRRALNDPDKLTFSKMHNVLMAMGYDVEGVSIRLRDRLTGEVRTFSTDDTVEELKSRLEEEKSIGIDSL